MRFHTVRTLTLAGLVLAAVAQRSSAQGLQQPAMLGFTPLLDSAGGAAAVEWTREQIRLGAWLALGENHALVSEDPLLAYSYNRWLVTTGLSSALGWIPAACRSSDPERRPLRRESLSFLSMPLSHGDPKDGDGDPVFLAAVAPGFRSVTPDQFERVFVRQNGGEDGDHQLYYWIGADFRGEFEAMTERIIGSPLGLVVDGYVVCAPIVTSGFAGPGSMEFCAHTRHPAWDEWLERLGAEPVEAKPAAAEDAAQLVGGAVVQEVAARLDQRLAKAGRGLRGDPDLADRVLDLVELRDGLREGDEETELRDPVWTLGFVVAPAPSARAGDWVVADSVWACLIGTKQPVTVTVRAPEDAPMQRGGLYRLCVEPGEPEDGQVLAVRRWVEVD